MEKGLRKGSPLLRREISFWFIGEGSGSANLCAKGLAITKVARDGPLGNRMKRRRTIRTGIETGLAPDASFFVRYDRIGSGGALSGASGTDINAGGLFALLTDDGHKDRDFFPFLHLYP
jgi:hypothetical protein